MTVKKQRRSVNSDMRGKDKIKSALFCQLSSVNSQLQKNGNSELESKRHELHKLCINYT